MRLKASSIYYALFLCVIIGLFLGGMILFAGINKQFEARIDIQDRLMNNANSGIEYGLTNYREISEEGSELLLFDSQIDSVNVHRKVWGAFEVIASEAHHGKFHSNKVTLCGHLKDPSESNLFVADLGRPISLCGETRLEGKCLLPKAGLERAYIEGQNYKGDKMVYGSEGIAERSLPATNQGFRDQITSIKGDVQQWDNPDSVNHSFHEEAIHFVHDGVVSLKDNSLNGYVYLDVRDSIFVGKDAQLDHVILRARVVYIQQGFKGNLQAYATERITLEEEVQLTYPSVLGIVEERFPEKENATITIGQKSQVLGSIFAISESPNFRLPVQISVEEEAIVHGLVYAQGRMQLKGIVNGSVYTSKFYLETPSSKYENHLLNAKIKNELPDDFVYIPIMETDEPLTKIEWLQ